MKTEKRGAKVARVLKYTLLVLATLSLVKIAFFPSNEETVQVSEGDFAQPTATLANASINNETKLSATILRDAPVPVRATASGEITTVFAGSGQAVNAGQAVIQVKKTTMPSATSSSRATTGGDDADSGAAEAAAAAPVVSYQNIAAQAGGTVELSVVLGQSVEVGQEIGTISPGRFHAVAQLKPSQLYSMGDSLRSGTLAITDGPAPFLCTEIKIVTTSNAPSTSGSGAGGAGAAAAASAGAAAGSGSGPQIRCGIPDDQTVYEGIPATLTIGGSTTGDVPTLPVTAVEGRFNEGVVFLPASDPTKKPVKRKVELGPNDGTNIEIKGGLKEGEEVLMFVPASAAEPGAAGQGSGSGGEGSGSETSGSEGSDDAPAAN